MKHAHALILMIFSLLWITSSLVACSEPAEAIAGHVDTMLTLSQEACPDCKALDTSDEAKELHAYLKEHPKVCKDMGESLNAYLKEHHDELADLLKQQGDSKSATAQRIYTTAKRLDIMTEGCRYDANVKTFQAAFSDLILKNALPQ